MDEMRLITVFTAQGEIEEDQVRAFLLAHEIPSFSRGEALRRTHSLNIDGLGQVEIQVAEGDADRARDLLARVEAGEFTLEDNET